MERGKTSTKCAGIDVGKRWLDASVHGVEGVIRVANAAAGWSELIGWLGERHGSAFADPTRLRAALDQRFVPLDAPLGAAREVAIFPPVTGG